MAIGDCKYYKAARSGFSITANPATAGWSEVAAGTGQDATYLTVLDNGLVRIAFDSQASGTFQTAAYNGSAWVPMVRSEADWLLPTITLVNTNNSAEIDVTVNWVDRLAVSYTTRVRLQRGLPAIEFKVVSYGSGVSTGLHMRGPDSPRYQSIYSVDGGVVYNDGTSTGATVSVTTKNWIVLQQDAQLDTVLSTTRTSPFTSYRTALSTTIGVIPSQLSAGHYFWIMGLKRDYVNRGSARSTMVRRMAADAPAFEGFAPLVGAELLTNGTFETDLSGWTVVSGSWARTTAQKKFGVASVETSSATANFRQNVSVVAGTKYALTGWVRTAGATAGTVYLQAQRADSTLIAEASAVFGREWTYVSVVFTAPATESARVNVLANSSIVGPIQVDAVSLIALPSALECESTTGWTGGTFSTTTGVVNGTLALAAVVGGAASDLRYAFATPQDWSRYRYVSFWAKSSTTDTVFLSLRNSAGTWVVFASSVGNPTIAATLTTAWRQYTFDLSLVASIVPLHDLHGFGIADAAASSTLTFDRVRLHEVDPLVGQKSGVLSDMSDERLKAWYKFDELALNASGIATAADSAGDGRTLTRSLMPWFRRGKVGRSVACNGYSQSVNGIADYHLAQRDTTIAMWLYPFKVGQAALATNRNIGDATQAGWSLLLTSGGLLRLDICDGSTVEYMQTSASIGLAAEVWTHVAVVYDPVLMQPTFYVNGAAVARGGLNGGAGTAFTIAPATSQYGQMRIGGEDTSPNTNTGHEYAWDGLINDWRLYGRKLSASEADALYDLGMGTGSLPIDSTLHDRLGALIAWYPGDAGSGTSVTDRTTAANHATIAGSGRNMVTNPSFETALSTEWATEASGAVAAVNARTAATSFGGATHQAPGAFGNYLRLQVTAGVAASGDNYIGRTQTISGVAEARPYTISGYAKRVSGAGRPRWVVQFLDAGSAVLATHDLTHTPTVADGNWQRFELATTAAPTGTKSATIRLRMQLATAGDVGEVHLDAIQFEQGSVASPYADKPGWAMTHLWKDDFESYATGALSLGASGSGYSMNVGGTFTVTTERAAAGTKSLKIETTTMGNGLFRFWAQNPKALSAVVRIRCKVWVETGAMYVREEQSSTQVNLSAKAAWQQVDMTVTTTTATGSAIDFYQFGATASTFFIDDFEVWHEPSTTQSLVKRGANCLDFDGVNDNVVLPDEAEFDQNAFTVMAWVRPTRVDAAISASGNANHRYIASKRQGSVGNSDWGLYIDQTTGRPGFTVWDASDVGYSISPASGSVLTVGDWVHVAATRNGSTIKLYLNGALVATKTDAPATFNNSTTPVRIGAHDSNVSGHFHGQIDDFRYASREMTLAEIDAAYRLDPTGIEYYYDFGETSGTTVADGSGNARNATYTDDGMVVLAGKFGNGYKSSPTEYLQAASSFPVGATTGFTLEAWFNADRLHYGYPLSGPGTPYIGVKDTGAVIGSWIDSGLVQQTITSPSGSYAAGAWTHVVLTHDGTVARLYVNGKLSVSGTFSFLGKASFAPCVGTFSEQYTRDGVVTGNGFDGLIDEARFYDAPLGADEVAMRYNLGQAIRGWSVLTGTGTLSLSTDSKEGKALVLNQPSSGSVIYRFPQPVDLSGFGSLSFWAKRTGAGNWSVRLTDQTGVEATSGTFAVTASYARYALATSLFTGIDLTRVISIRFVADSTGDNFIDAVMLHPTEVNSGDWRGVLETNALGGYVMSNKVGLTTPASTDKLRYTLHAPTIGQYAVAVRARSATAAQSLTATIGATTLSAVLPTTAWASRPAWVVYGTYDLAAAGDITLDLAPAAANSDFGVEVDAIVLIPLRRTAGTPVRDGVFPEDLAGALLNQVTYLAPV